MKSSGGYYDASASFEKLLKGIQTSTKRSVLEKAIIVQLEAMLAKKAVKLDSVVKKIKEETSAIEQELEVQREIDEGGGGLGES